MHLPPYIAFQRIATNRFIETISQMPFAYYFVLFREEGKLEIVELQAS